MIGKKKTIIVSLAVFLLCFIFFGVKAFTSTYYAEAVKQAEISNTNSRLEYIKSELAELSGKGENLQKEEKEACEEQISCLNAVIDGWNDGNWEERIQNENRDIELEFEKKKFGATSWTDEAIMRDKLAFNQALLDGHSRPRDGVEDGISSALNLLKDWIFYLVPLCVIFLTSDLISVEKASGSIKLLMQSPKTKTGIYIHKFFSGLRLSLVAVSCAILGAFAGGAVFGGIGSLNYPFFFNSSYSQTWKIFLPCLLVLILSVIFYTALGLFLSTFSYKGILFALGSTAAVSALVILGRKAVITSRGNAWQFTPFECGDSFSAVIGKVSVPPQEALNNLLNGNIVPANSKSIIEINTALPIWGSVFVLIFCSVILLIVGAQIFNKKDIV